MLHEAGTWYSRVGAYATSTTAVTLVVVLLLHTMHTENCVPVLLLYNNMGIPVVHADTPVVRAIGFFTPRETLRRCSH